MPLTPEIIFTIFLGIPVALLLTIGLRHLRAGKEPLLLVCLAGGLLACVWEPIVDTMGLCYIKEGAELSTYTILDRTMPLFIPFVYTWYVGGLAYIAYRLYAAGITARGMFALYLIDCGVNIWLESPGVLLGAYEYYGSQPLDFWGLPLWWTLMNPLMPMIGGALIYRLRPHLTGWRILGVIPIIPMVDGITNAGIGWPMWITLNNEGISLVWTHLAALATFLLALYVVWMLGFLVGRPAEQVRRLTKLELLREALSGDPPPPVPGSAPVPGAPAPGRVPVGAPAPALGAAAS
ncbi:hypothetical protein [Conexibacter sp. SYSU D00693]|uniref:hypothetical protein n=1 Tax=Conexibacter sp. SYSU D00693 TaxID=2812560 RepID=UPI00196A4DF0